MEIISISKIMDSALKKGSDSIKILGVMKDVTEKKETKELLKRIEETRKKEIHHRVKNNLQVISFSSGPSDGKL